MLAEQVKIAPQQAMNPSVDMTVPAAVRNRSQRQICFEDSPAGSNVTSLPDDSKSMKVSLMARGKGNKLVLKTVSIEESALHEAWKKEREKEDLEREDIKRVTLGHTARIFAEEEQEIAAADIFTQPIKPVIKNWWKRMNFKDVSDGREPLKRSLFVISRKEKDRLIRCLLTLKQYLPQ
ncbi:Regulator of nonsense transcripts upf2 [Parelaphostrongylus tenuis]|uniref:Regulator of nonsense transcripts upf2 n=1 Tax=Parelaphostrongylus tenuis TaxID=148309 RepID=A0AAD5QPG1_PARTN|nr:Regulator of nonsense transcripts upf2 [Parelaphostrongylus tenuis]